MLNKELIINCCLQDIDNIENLFMCLDYEDVAELFRMHDPSLKCNLQLLKLIKTIKAEKFHLALVKRNGEWLELIPNPTQKVILMAISSDPFAIRHVEKVTPKLWKAALSISPSVIYCITNPTKAMLSQALNHEHAEILFHSHNKVLPIYTKLLHMKNNV